MPSASLPEPETFAFADDGSIPNNPSPPFLIYRGGIDLKGSAAPEEQIESMFASSDWGEMWRNGVDRFAHDHAMIHQAVGLARGRARVQFGGKDGVEIDVLPADVCVLPAGTGHQCLWATPDLVVTGSSPPSGKYDLCRGSKAEHACAIAAVAGVAIPQTDPVFGRRGALTRLWRP